MRMCTIVKCKPCTTCTIKACKYNQNPVLEKEIKTAIEIAIEEELYKREGCPYDK